ncbi:hypothetical protein ACSX1A_01695 [Pontibacter sp. MBLB2868]|uniref:hypothetical protein n=1 Tax=Pontibacter sp. MBLB2868 TaxID=3451555 RepID=UPI003F74FC52
METSTNQLPRVSRKGKLHLLTYYQKKFVSRLSSKGVIAAFLCLLLLLTQCQPIVEEDPQPLNDNVTSQQSVMPLNGSVQCIPGMLDGAITLICVPENWNGELIMYARGYTPAFVPLSIAEEVEMYAPLFTSLGYAFATSSYSQNGLAIQTGIQDMINLRNYFIENYGAPKEIYLTGASEGGLVTTLAIERYPELWSGGLSLCGPCGDFQRQINYYGNFRVLFDYFFPGVLPGSLVNVPADMITDWETVYVPRIIAAISQDPSKTLTFLNVVQAPYDPNNFSTVANTFTDVLRYNLFVQDAIIKLGGLPFDNTDYVYTGTGSVSGDIQLNEEVQRYAADKEALKTIKKEYETQGIFKKPLVKAHTTGDPIALIWNLALYQEKVPIGKSSLFAAFPVQRYGHCNFEPSEAVAFFTALLQKVEAQKQHPLAKQKGLAAAQ